jgi:DGQHR domain-containing protein
MSTKNEIPAIKVHQWLDDWRRVRWSGKERRAEPQHWFYMFSISAPDLKALSGIYARSTKERTRGTEDLGIQRRHEVERSEEIARFVRFGYPWSSLSRAKRESEEFKDLQKPGWLPTAIVVNILKQTDERLGKRVDAADLVEIEDQPTGLAKVRLPKGFNGAKWKHRGIPPVEVIDGQHRLWAFEDSHLDGDLQLPVVAFVGLDLSWQAYLFYTINIKPKKINASLAFDLYPLLRTEDWLAKFEGHVVYRETRAQELVDLLWSHPESPWHKRINMLGEPGYKGLMVSQSAWIRSLLASYIKSWEGRGVRIGGLFGAPVGSHKQALPWSRREQAAFLIVVGKCLKDAVSGCSESWAHELRKTKQPTLFPAGDDPAFFGQHSLLNQDQGIRAFLQATNDFCFLEADKLSLATWGGRSESEETDEGRILSALNSLRKQQKIMAFLKEVATVLATYDWRASSAPGLTEQESMLKAAFRGSGGYKELRRHLLRQVGVEPGRIGRLAKQVLDSLGY